MRPRTSQGFARNAPSSPHGSEGPVAPSVVTPAGRERACCTRDTFPRSPFRCPLCASRERDGREEARIRIPSGRRRKQRLRKADLPRVTGQRTLRGHRVVLQGQPGPGGQHVTQPFASRPGLVNASWQPEPRRCRRLARRRPRQPRSPSPERARPSRRPLRRCRENPSQSKALAASRTSPRWPERRARKCKGSGPPRGA